MPIYLNKPIRFKKKPIQSLKKLFKMPIHLNRPVIFNKKLWALLMTINKARIIRIPKNRMISSLIKFLRFINSRPENESAIEHSGTYSMSWSLSR